MFQRSLVLAHLTVRRTHVVERRRLIAAHLETTENGKRLVVVVERFLAFTLGPIDIADGVQHLRFPEHISEFPNSRERLVVKIQGPAVIAQFFVNDPGIVESHEFEPERSTGSAERDRLTVRFQRLWKVAQLLVHDAEAVVDPGGLRAIVDGVRRRQSPSRILQGFLVLFQVDPHDLKTGERDGLSTPIVGGFEQRESLLEVFQGSGLVHHVGIGNTQRQKRLSLEPPIVERARERERLVVVITCRLRSILELQVGVTNPHQREALTRRVISVSKQRARQLELLERFLGRRRAGL